MTGVEIGALYVMVMLIVFLSAAVGVAVARGLIWCWELIFD